MGGSQEEGRARMNLRPPRGPSLALSFWPEPPAPLGTRLPTTLSTSFLLRESGLADPYPVTLDVQLSSQEERPFPKAGRLRKANSIVCKAGAINLSMDLFPPLFPLCQPGLSLLLSGNPGSHHPKGPLMFLRPTPSLPYPSVPISSITPASRLEWILS